MIYRFSGFKTTPQNMWAGSVDSFNMAFVNSSKNLDFILVSMNSGALLRIKMSTFCFVFKGTDARFTAEIAQPLKKDGHYFLRGAGLLEI